LIFLSHIFTLELGWLFPPKSFPQLELRKWKDCQLLSPVCTPNTSMNLAFGVILDQTTDTASTISPLSGHGRLNNELNTEHWPAPGFWRLDEPALPALPARGRPIATDVDREAAAWHDHTFLVGEPAQEAAAFSAATVSAAAECSTLWSGAGNGSHERGLQEEESVDNVGFFFIQPCLLSPSSFQGPRKQTICGCLGCMGGSLNKYCLFYVQVLYA
jgi:hypothetical protein